MTTLAPPRAVALAPPGRPRLAARLWAGPTSRALVVVSHGHGEHGGCYAGLARDLVPGAGVDVLAFDYRGHGLSEGRRGYLPAYRALLDDLAAWLDWAARERPGWPVFVLGHSNGGLAAIRLVESGRAEPAGLILSNPSLRLIAEAPLWKRLAGRVLLGVAPWVTFSTGIDGDQLTGAAEAAALLEADPLRHHRISPPTYFGMVAQGPLAIEQAGRVRVPTLLILGDEDPITAPAAAREFFGRLGAADKTLFVGPGMRHEPLHEVERDRVVAAIAGWLAARTPSTNPTTPHDPLPAPNR